jgi:hypothetical protein
MKRIQIGENVHLDIERLRETRMMLQASSGAGKTNAVRLVSEQLIGAGQQVVVIDPEGEFSTLRERFDLLVIGKGGDIPADIRSAGMLAVRLMELGASAVVDLFDMPRDDRRAFVKAFLSAMHDAPRSKWRDIFVVIDEAHDYCSEDGAYASGPAVESLMGQGRKRGNCGILVTLRLSKLSKDAAAEANNVLIGCTTLDVDLKRAGDALGFGKQRWPEIKGLARGEFFAFGPAFSFTGVEKIMLHKAATAPPPRGPDRGHAVPVRASVAVKKIVGELADIAERSKGEIVDLDAAKHRIGVLEDELARANADPGPCVRCAELESELSRSRERYDRLREWTDQICGVRDMLISRLATLESLIGPVTPGVYRGPIEKRDLAPPAPRVAVDRVAPSAARDGLTKSMCRLLDALAWFESVGILAPERSVVAGMAGASPTSGTLSENLKLLRDGGLIEYPAPSCVGLTDAGRLVAEKPSRPARLSDLHEKWRACRSLTPAMLKILNIVILQGRSGMIPKDALADEAGVSRTSGTFSENLADLNKLGIIRYPKPGFVGATSLLFPEGLR